MPECDDEPIWLISPFSGGGNCVAVARLADDQIGVRNSRDTVAEAQVFTRDEWAAFLAGVKHGDFDHI